MRPPVRVDDSAARGPEPIDLATRGPRGTRLAGAGGRYALALECQERYRRQRLARGRVMMSLPDRGSDAVPLLRMSALTALRHPDILPIEDWGTEEGVPYATTPAPSADSLSAALVEGRVRGPAAIDLLAVIALAVDFAHERGVVHGCLEPAAILLDRDGRPLVTDFGLASLVAAAASPAGVCYLDSAFVAPERMLGRGAGRSSDVYAFAAIAYEVLTGEAPFASVANTADKVFALLHSDPVRPSGVDGAIPHAVDEAVMGGLARDPASRWQSCTAMLQALECSFAAPPKLPPLRPALEVAPQVTFPMVEAPVKSEPHAGVPPRPASSKKRRHRFARTVGVAILCALATAGGAVFSAQHREQDLRALPGIGEHVPATDAQRLGPAGPGATTATPAGTAAPAPTAPPAPAVQALGIKVSPALANRGSVVNVTGAGFNAAQKFTIDLTQGGTDYQLQPATQVQPTGIFSVSAIIPGQAASGPATVSACNVTSSGATGACAQQQITIA